MQLNVTSCKIMMKQKTLKDKKALVGYTLPKPYIP